MPKFAIAVEYRDVIHIEAETKEQALKDAVKEFETVAKAVATEGQMDFYVNARILGNPQENRFPAPREGIEEYRAKTSGGDIVSILDMSGDELRHELGACYDVMGDTVCDLEDGDLDDIVKARDAMAKFMYLTSAGEAEVVHIPAPAALGVNVLKFAPPGAVQLTQAQREEILREIEPRQ